MFYCCFSTCTWLCEFSFWNGTFVRGSWHCDAAQTLPVHDHQWWAFFVSYLIIASICGPLPQAERTTSWRSPQWKFSSRLACPLSTCQRAQVGGAADFLIPLNSHFFHHCHSLFCGNDNGSNHIFVPHHNSSAGGVGYHIVAAQTGPHTTSAAWTAHPRMLRRQGIKWCLSNWW